MMLGHTMLILCFTDVKTNNGKLVNGEKEMKRV